MDSGIVPQRTLIDDQLTAVNLFQQIVIDHFFGRVCVGLLLGMALCAPAGAGSLPERFAARFVLSANGLDIGLIRWRLSPAGAGRYVYESHSETIGVAKLLRDERIDERSEWSFSNGGVRPLHYSYSRSGGKRLREVEVRFDWSRLP